MEKLLSAENTPICESDSSLVGYFDQSGQWNRCSTITKNTWLDKVLEYYAKLSSEE
jgi:hypothetical protein